MIRTWSHVRLTWFRYHVCLTYVFKPYVVHTLHVCLTHVVDTLRLTCVVNTIRFIYVDYNMRLTYLYLLYVYLMWLESHVFLITCNMYVYILYIKIFESHLYTWQTHDPGLWLNVFKCFFCLSVQVVKIPELPALGSSNNYFTSPSMELHVIMCQTIC